MGKPPLDHLATEKVRDWLKGRHATLVSTLIRPQMPDETERLRGEIRGVLTMLNWLDDDTVSVRRN